MKLTIAALAALLIATAAPAIAADGDREGYKGRSSSSQANSMRERGDRDVSTHRDRKHQDGHSNDDGDDDGRKHASRSDRDDDRD